ncbi:hypothetical protein WR25_06275 [Diploscapter pachys]|uniref:Methyltransferase FkbM domain-containing protein n=1 Tax=Diploscapter pachys TaxID=2018661 RepID=A0A2A2LXF0_9BILA|nr:hypothetical protein WR25_06275 [Diploscapter pachys]
MKQYSDCGRLTIFEDHQLDMDCDSVRRRVMGNNVYSKLNRPIVIIRNIYTSYPMQEAFMSLSYHPENSYCFVMDSKSNATFTYKMKKLARCFDNIYISDKTYDFDSSGHYQDYAHFDCLRISLEKDKNWNHALLLQNYDLIIKTPSELSSISEIFNGTHIFGLRGPPRLARYDRYADWSAKGLKIWKNESGKLALQLKSSLLLGDGYNEVFVSRNLIQAIFDELNVDNLLERFNDMSRYGIDEQFLQTMIINSWLGLPDQLPYHCERRMQEFGRYSHFHNGWIEIFRHLDLHATLYDGCKSGKSRHGICLMGVEYLPRLGEMEHLLGNKPHPEFDFGTMMCVGEYLHDIEFGKRTRHINWALYENSVQLWPELQGIITICDQTVKDILKFRDFENLDEVKYHILPTNPDSKSVIVTIGIGNDVKAEEGMKAALKPGTSKFYGVDPIYKGNNDLYRRVGNFYSFGISSESGMQKIIDQILFDAENSEYKMMHLLYENGRLDQANITICQFNMELHEPDDHKKRQIHDFLFRILKDRRYAFFKAFQSNHLRLYFFNFQSDYCVKKYTHLIV